ncbi:2OG-Fe(II) oxygenase [Phenylobacterium deserti]|uniref:2OG-Fe(II) oxygenase n=1 Tax=Phenylobacterium deserti TaxID=1914756 RepID=A0A328APE1_9CAUL|nr:2OG-Fe(II) oxygenase [Phenylobacterium deserti]RAK56457.1 2OG-Fe(II) oxygenase [Phenylobacterium deserti]
MDLQLGTPAPLFSAPSHTNPEFALGAIGGRYVLLGFLPQDAEGRAAMLGAVEGTCDLFHESRVMVFLVERDAERYHAAVEKAAVRWFHDAEGEIAKLYGAADAEGALTGPRWVLLDPTLRLIAWRPADATALMFSTLRRLGLPENHAGVPLHAPVLIVPRVLEPQLCRRLIDLYQAHGGEQSGTMRTINGRTVGVLSNMKDRRDAPIEDPALQDALRARITRRLLPEIAKAFCYKATRIERYIVACYDASSGGFFRPHRDNTTAGTAHRQFAVSINLNSEEFEGGDLRFPEYGTRTYRPPTGGAVVFSCSLLHEATPVTKGVRYATLPFLYDEAGAAIREANLHLLDPSPAMQLAS